MKTEYFNHSLAGRNGQAYSWMQFAKVVASKVVLGIFI